ncbi:hypothetical protein BD414DRAFT_182264 [Trametes punicea]|nr:hypothetical protein BD414DRAFT_182264 [Trametes punicea]
MGPVSVNDEHQRTREYLPATSATTAMALVPGPVSTHHGNRDIVQQASRTRTCANWLRPALRRGGSAKRLEGMTITGIRISVSPDRWRRQLVTTQHIAFPGNPSNQPRHLFWSGTPCRYCSLARSRSFESFRFSPTLPRIHLPSSIVHQPPAASRSPSHANSPAFPCSFPSLSWPGASTCAATLASSPSRLSESISRPILPLSYLRLALTVHPRSVSDDLL